MAQDDEVITTPLGEGLVLARRHGHHLFALNESARFIWERRAEGIADAEIPALMATRYGIDPAQAVHDFGAAMDEWRAKGLAEDDGPWRYYAIGGRVFRVHCDDPDHETVLAPVLAHLALPDDDRDGRAPAMTVVLGRTGDDLAVHRDGAETYRGPSLDTAIEKIAAHVVMFVFDGGGWVLSVHAAAVGNAAGCVLMPGNSGSGKSTITAALLSRGHGYLTDDIVLFEPDNLHAMPLPCSLTLKSGSWDALAPYLDGLADQPVRRRLGKDTRYWPPPRERIAPRPLPVKVRVFPCHAEAAATRLVPLTALDALNRIVAAPSSIAAPADAGTIRRIVDWVERVPAYRLEYGALEEAVAEVEGLLAT